MNHGSRCLLILVVMFGSGCTTYRAYLGEQLPRQEVATLEVPASVAAVDGQVIGKRNVNAVELLPGEHEIEWVFTYPNGFSQPRQIAFRACVGESYKLQERFFPTPNRNGVLGATIEMSIDVATLPMKLLFPGEAPSGPPEGEYYAWVTQMGSPAVVVTGQAPDLPLPHAPLTFVPVGEGEGP